MTCLGHVSFRMSCSDHILEFCRVSHKMYYVPPKINHKKEQMRKCRCQHLEAKRLCFSPEASFSEENTKERGSMYEHFASGGSARAGRLLTNEFSKSKRFSENVTFPDCDFGYSQRDFGEFVGIGLGTLTETIARVLLELLAAADKFISRHSSVCP